MAKLRIVPLKKNYLEFLRKTRSHPEVNKYMTEDVVISKTRQQKWYKNYLKKKDIKIFIAIINNIPVGYSQIRNIDKKNSSCELVFCVAPEFQSRGYGKELCKKTTDYAAKRLKMHRIWLEALGFNKRAINLYKKCGFRKEKIFKNKVFKADKFHNVIVMGATPGIFK